ncbi:hypothetical protein KDA00_02660 [Candidatus Saccharibacteria bacterium]|nr:hypothetical protein [Candidatus Saccharibacteria bacterium]
MDIVQRNTRYVPFTQQASCCVPTSIQMIMYRNDIPLIPAEELGYYLGLTVSPENKHLFYNPRTSDEPPSTAGYGTQIFVPEFKPNKVFEKLGIPLSFEIISANSLNNEKNLMDQLKDIEAQNLDALLCFNHGVIIGEYKPHSGHVAVFDRIIDNEIQLVDASSKQPKWRLVQPSLMFEAIKKHGLQNSAGIWIFEKI